MNLRLAAARHPTFAALVLLASACSGDGEGAVANAPAFGSTDDGAPGGSMAPEGVDPEPTTDDDGSAGGTGMATSPPTNSGGTETAPDPNTPLDTEGVPDDGAADPNGMPGEDAPGEDAPGEDTPDEDTPDTGVVPPDFGQPIGFATLNGGTTGGRAGPTVTASTYADLKSLAESAGPRTILVGGNIENGPSGGILRVASDKSLIGVGSTAFLSGIGIDINNANNIILQNLRVSMIGVTTRTETAGVFTTSNDEGRPKILVNDGDAISIRGTSKNVWIDHCELFSVDPAAQTNIDLYDGLIDIKNQTAFITVSWSYLHDHHKAGLVGSSDTDLFADRKVTFHHNHYENVRGRIPMYRGSVGHFFNNYVDGANDATEIRAGTCVRVERNYYEALHFSIYTPSDAPGSTERIDNREVSRTARAYPANCTADIPYPYAEALTDTDDVSTLVPQLAGVGRR